MSSTCLKYTRFVVFPVFVIAVALCPVASAFVIVRQKTIGTTQCTMAAATRSNLRSVEDCLENYDKIRFIDGTWYHKGNRNGRQE